MLHYRLEPRKECVRVGRRQNANRPGGGGVWRPGGPAGPRACQTKGWSRRPQAACSSLFGRFAPCRRPPGRLEVPSTPKGSGKPGPAPYGAWQAKRWREGPRPRLRPSGPSRCPAGSGGIPRRRRKAARKSPRPIGGGFCEPQGGLRPPGDSFPGCACPLAPRRRWRCGRGAP